MSAILLGFVLSACERDEPVSVPVGTVLTPDAGTLWDGRNGRTYRTVRIGELWWMAENLDFDTLDGTGSSCYGGVAANCAADGRLYSWTAAMGLPERFADSVWEGTAPRQGVCPPAWHVPTESEWHGLTKAVDSLGARDRLVQTYGWAVTRSGETEYWTASQAGEGEASIRVWSASRTDLFASRRSKPEHVHLRCVQDP